MLNKHCETQYDILIFLPIFFLYQESETMFKHMTLQEPYGCFYKNKKGTSSVPQQLPASPALFSWLAFATSIYNDYIVKFITVYLKKNLSALGNNLPHLSLSSHQMLS